MKIHPKPFINCELPYSGISQHNIRPLLNSMSNGCLAACINAHEGYNGY